MALAIPLLLLGCGSAALAARFLASAERGVAEVVSSQERPNGRSDLLWTTTFSFEAPDGTRLTASWTGERRSAPGGAVRVVYRRAPFVRIQPDNPRAAWGWTWVWVGLGGLQVLLGGALFLLGATLRRRKLRWSAA